MNAPSWTYTIFKPDQSSRSFQTVFALSIVVYVTFNGTKDLEDFDETLKPLRLLPQEHNGRQSQRMDRTL